MAKKTKDSNLSIEERLEQALIPNWDEPYKLPENWCWTHWGNCGQFVAGGAFKEKYQRKKGLPIPFYKVGSLKYSDGFGYLYDDGNTIDEKIRNELKVSVVPVNSILFAKIGEAIRLNRRSLNGVPCCIDNNLMAFIPNNKCYYKYVYYWSKGVDLYQYANATAVPAIRKTDLESIPFPLAPYEAQIEIVKRIESLFIKLDEAKEKAQEVVDGYESRKAAILHKAFSGELTAKWRSKNEISIQTWDIQKLKNCGTWCGGGTPSMQHPEYWENGNLLWITAKDMKSDIITETQMLTNMLGVENSSANYIEKPSILFVMRSGILRRTLPIAMVKIPFTVNQDLKVLTPDKLNLEYLFWACKAFERDILKKCMKSGTTVESINSHALLEYELPIPQKREQEEIVSIIKALIAKEVSAIASAEAIIDQIDTMKKAILTRAFRGELGTNDPNEESAVELLKKVLGGDADVQAPAKKPTKRISIPSDIKDLLSNIREEEIIKLLLKASSQPVSIQEIMALSSKKFELMDALRSLEKKQLITKNESGEYSLTR